MKNNRIRNISAALFTALIFFILFKDAFQAGKMLFGSDFLTIYLPFKVFARHMFFVYHDLPLWMPNIFFGMPIYASSSLLYFYPTDFLFMLLPIPLQYTYAPDVMIHMLAAGAGMYLFLRSMGMEKNSGLLGGLFVMMSGFLVSFAIAGHINNIKAGSLIPFVFYFGNMGIRNKKVSYFLACGLVMALQIFATGMQIMAYTFMAFAMYVLYVIIFEEKETKSRLYFLFMLLLAGLFSVLFSAAQFFPSFQYKDYSWRGNFTYNDFISWSMNPKELITMILPQFFGLTSENYRGYMSLSMTTYYMGILPLLFVPFAFLTRKHKKMMIFIAAAAAFFFLLSFGGYTPLYKLFYHVPVFNQFRNPSRFIYVASFLIVIMAASGLNSVINIAGDKNYNSGFKASPVLKVWKYWVIVLATVAAAAAVILLNENMITGIITSSYRDAKNAEMPLGIVSAAVDTLKNDLLWMAGAVIIAALMVYLFARRRLKSAFIFIAILACFHFADTYRIERNFVKTGDYSNFVSGNDAVSGILKQDKEPGRVADFGFLWGPNKALYSNLETVKGLHGLVPLLFINMENKQLFNLINLNRAFNIKYYITADEIKAPGIRKLEDYGKMKLSIDTLAKPRAYFTNSVIEFDTEDKVLEFMKNGIFSGEPAVTAEKTGLLQPNGPSPVYKIDMTEYTPNRIKMMVNTGRPGLLVLSNAYYPEWRSKINGSAEKVYRVNYDAMAVKVDSGTSTVEFYYSRTVTYLSIMTSILAFAVFGFVLWFERRKSYAKKQS